jgi:hypothetical protein
MRFLRNIVYETLEACYGGKKEWSNNILLLHLVCEKDRDRQGCMSQLRRTNRDEEER